ncbi:tetratricopeptide repeat protein [Pedobacter immunditicola]|uniref:tetratricopeptide repeat protein n=1 Tax=Pedobacter immunditicola TaxID=3133440 RepID=UPI0030A79772
MKMTKKAIALSLGLVVMGSASFAQSLDDAKKALDAEQYQKATSMLKSLVNSQASKGENYYYLGEVYLRTDYVDSARAVFTKGVAADPKFALNYVGLGEADLASENPTSAKTNFDKAIDVASKKDYIPSMFIGKAYVAAPKPDFTAALPYLQKADELDKADKAAETFLALGDFYAAQKKNSEALQNYLRALNINPNLHRAKVQIGRMYKESRAFPESESALKEVIAADPNYGPAYREIAELYMQWANFEPQNFDAKAALALENYKKYLDLTDKSFESKLRYAQFLFYAKDFQTLEQVTSELASVSPNDPKAPVVLRMRGYSAYENKNYPQSLQYMNDFFAKTKDTSRIVGSDYLYLGKAYLQSGNDSLALVNITKAVEKDSTNVEALTEVAKAFYDAKNYQKAADIYDKAIAAAPNAKGVLYSYYYNGLARYFQYAAGVNANTSPSKDILVKADSAIAKVTALAPETTDAYLWRGRINSLLDDEQNPKGLMVPHFEAFVQKVTVDKPELAAANAKKLAEAYDQLGAFYAVTDKEKAKEYFTKSVAANPAGTFAPAKLKEMSAPAAKAGTKRK